jgi:hypothetical protein
MADGKIVSGTNAWTNGEPVPDTRERLLVLCDCNDPEHQFMLHFDNEDDIGDDWPREFYLTNHLPKRGFWQRLVYAWKYLWGWQSKYGAFAEVLLGEKQALEVYNFLDEYLTRVEADRQVKLTQAVDEVVKNAVREPEA